MHETNHTWDSTTWVDRFLVCGLGSLGQYCVHNLKKFALPGFEVHVTAIDRVKQRNWEVENLGELLAEEPIIGDCCNEQVLLRAGVKYCRAILLVTSSESVNIEGAIASLCSQLLTGDGALKEAIWLLRVDGSWLHKSH